MRKTIGAVAAAVSTALALTAGATAPAVAANLSSSSPATENVERLPGNAAEHADFGFPTGEALGPVSYTHLTLPTIYSV